MQKIRYKLVVKFLLVLCCCLPFVFFGREETEYNFPYIFADDMCLITNAFGHEQFKFLNIDKRSVEQIDKGLHFMDDTGW